MNTMRPDILVEGLRMAYGQTQVLHGVNLHVDRGEVVALLGPNGAGKTTTIEILEGFRAPSEGRVDVLGENPLAGGEGWRARVGVVLQSWRDHPKWKVRELLHHLGEFYRPFSTQQTTRPWDTDDLLSKVGLTGKADRPIAKLSGGERRRLDVAVGLVGRPELVFLDEPTAGFDPQARRDFHDLIRGLADSQTTLLLTTHDLDEAEKLADRILVLAGGHIVADGTPDALRHRASVIAEVRYRLDGGMQVHSTDDPAAYLRGVLCTADGARVTDLEVRRASLEDAYLSLVHRFETTPPGAGEHHPDLWAVAHATTPKESR